MDDPHFQEKYQKYKLRVKVWEKNFRSDRGRIPSKYDIREASVEIRQAYKMYYKLKTALLEDTLNDVLSEDGFDVLEMDGATAADDDLSTSINGGPQLPLDISSIVSAVAEEKSSMAFSNVDSLPPFPLLTASDYQEDAEIKEFEAVEELEQNAKAWGSSVSNKSKSFTKPSERKSFKLNLNQKHFTSSPSVPKRNPRKSLSRSTLDQSVRKSGFNEGLDLGPVLPDLETILLQKSKEQTDAEPGAGILLNPLLGVDPKKETPRTQVDDAWLCRTEAQNGIAMGPAFQPTTPIAQKKINYGLSNLDVSKLRVNKKPAEPVTPKAAAPLVATAAPVEPMAVTPEEPKTPMAVTLTAKKKSKPPDSDSESVVSDSEDEKDSQEYRHIAKRRRVLSTLNTSQDRAEGTAPPKAVVKSESDANPANPIKTEEKKSAKSGESDVDFSADDDKDKDYDFKDDMALAKRKKAVPKRAAVKKKPAPKEKKPRVPRKKAEPKEPPPKRPVRKKKPPPGNEENAVEEGEPEERPLDPEDLKYALVLEQGDITSVPRVKPDDLDAADVIAQRYINTAASMPGAKPSAGHVYVDEKRQAAREKLEAKIASGKLNENFVTINIKKKMFVRGKKSVNFSKYKKKMWKDKKRVQALSGPDMYMGGCDGGTLKCFTCGQAGHFAQECKVKGDALLPLTATLEEDPSPFPTLEEAAEMASQSAIVVHSRNLSKLPMTTNAAIYQNSSLAEEASGEPAQAAEPMDATSQEVKAMPPIYDFSDAEEAAARDEKEALSSSDLSDAEAAKAQDSQEEICFETDEELEQLDLDAAVDNALAQPKVSPIKKYVGHKIPADFLRLAGLDGSQENSTPTSTQGAMYALNPDGSIPDVTPEVLEALHLFGHSSFRKGQDRAVMRILCGQSTLVTLSTGSGKSLCYQLPAYLYSRQKRSITLVISPLVSLMEDQVTGVPHFLRAHCLHKNQTPHTRLKVLQMIRDGEVDVLLVSPEAVVAGERSTGFGSILRQLPPIAFACIDEAHCVSQWSHNFRPSYLMICKVLKKNLGVNCVLGLTATATLPTRLSIIDHLGIADGERGVITDTPLPDNLVLSVSKDENREAALLNLLHSKRFEACQSIIIYCTRRDECERISSFLRTSMQDRVVETTAASRKRKRTCWQAEPYHAGMPASRRRTIQNAFMRNELRIVVATIAFGMGINKPDIRSVIHYNMPRNFESYVQEIGRAGRDGKMSHCHLFLDSRGGDQNELRRHVYANSIDRHVIRKLLQRIFVPCSCRTGMSAELAMREGKMGAGRVCPGHEIGFSIEKTVEALDIPEENIATLLCYMELDRKWEMNVLSNAYLRAKVMSYGGAKYLKHAAKQCPPLAMAIALEIKNNTFQDDANIIEFSVVDIAAAIGWNSGVVKYQLKNLEWVLVDGKSKRAPISVAFNDLGLRLKAPGDFSSEEIDDALDSLYNRSVQQEKTQLIQLQYVSQGLSSVAYNSYNPCASENFTTERSDQLKAIIRDYFQNDYPKDLKLEVESSTLPDDEIEGDIHSIINLYPDNTFTGRTIARIFHGISSPNYPALMWGRCKYWRAHSKVDFNRIVRLANAVIVKRRS